MENNIYVNTQTTQNDNNNKSDLSNQVNIEKLELNFPQNKKNLEVQNINQILNDQNYLLLLNENGKPDLEKDLIFSLPNNSNLIVKLFAGSKVSKNICLITSNNLNFFDEKKNEEVLAEESGISQSDNNDIPLLENNLTLKELKEISKFYNLKCRSFNEHIEDNNNKKIKIHDKINSSKIKKFEEHLFYPLIIDTDIYYIIPCNKPGPLTFFLIYEPFPNEKETPSSPLNQSSSSFDFEINSDPFFKSLNSFTDEITVNIEPRLLFENKSYNVDNLSMITILSKSLGKLSEWENLYKEAALLNYNIIHFTPIQIIGGSDSLYCLKDQTEINDTFFEIKFSKEEKNIFMKNHISELRKKYNIGSLVDIVLNHTAVYSEWLLQNPDSGYNLENSPHLNVSYELDCLILDYSKRFANKKVECKSAPFIYNDNDLNDTITELSNEIYRKNFEEFFMISIENNIEDFITFFRSYKKNFEEYLNKKKYLANKLIEKKLNYNNESHIYEIISESADNYGAARYGVKINSEFISILLIKDGFSENQFLAEVKKYLNKLNTDWKEKSKEFLKQAIENIQTSIRYEFIQLKRYKVTEKKRLVENYFTTFEPQNKRAVFACNGWLFGVNDPTVNFAKYGFWNYFNRSIVVWGDCVKLNFGNRPEDSPYLWGHMLEYVTNMAKIFDGFRLDNAHSTPIFVAEYLMNKAREVNPELIITAELFAGKKEREIEFVNRIGINLLIREIIYCQNSYEISENMHKFGGRKGRSLGRLEDKCDFIIDSNKILKYKNLTGKKPKSIVFDIAHDNPSLFEKYSNLGLNLTYLCCNSMTSSSIGSTRGFDQLYPYQPSVVKENRLYTWDDQFEFILEDHKKYFKINEIFDIKNRDKIFNDSIEENSGKGSFKKDNFILFEFIPSNNGINKTPGKVSLAISSNSWKPDILLEKINNNLWRTKIELFDGVYEYKYIVDNNWMHDKTKPIVKDKSNNINNQIIIGENNILDNSNDIIKSHDFFITDKDVKLIRREMNNMRKIISEFSINDSSELYIHQDRDILFIYRSLNRINSNDFNRTVDFDGYALISRNGFEQNKNNIIASRIELPGKIHELVFFANIEVPYFDLDKIRGDSKLIGVDSNLFFSKNMKNLYNIAKLIRTKTKDILDFHSLRPNTNILLKIKFDENSQNSVSKLKEKLDFLENDPRSLNLLKDVDLCDINHALFKCEEEELGNTNKKRGNYEFYEFGKLVYAGISHLNLVFQSTKKQQNLNHKIYENVRNGDWLLKYTFDRLNDSKGLVDLTKFLYSNIYENYINLPSHLKPQYITKIIDILYNLFIKKLYMKIEETIDLEKKGEFFKCLLVANLQFMGYIESSKFLNNSNTILENNNLSISAGLPHFSTEYMRCWGRDTFISFKGLLLIPGFFKEAKQILINFASTMRHGLIPNLLDCGNNPRFNARDAVWFFLQAIKDYLILSNDYDFLKHEIKMLFLDNDMSIHFEKLRRKEEKIYKIQDIILIILTNHVNGIDFREWKAGKQIDEHMKDEGFNIKIFLDTNNGFIYGGNASNCGTWMDKMGSSQKANNKGVPASPRNGADVELIGLLYSIVTFCSSLYEKKLINQNYISLDKLKIKNTNKLYFSDWACLIEENFEKFFYVGKKIFIDGLSTKEFYYKDYLLHDEKKYQEYQLRPNFLIAMALSPQLFTREKAMKALELAEKYLLVENGMGMKTLDYEDKFYRADYDNSNDSDDYFTAHGFNYHNGPEWVWPLGYYIMAKCYFNNFSTKEELKRYICSILIPHNKNILTDPWRGIPELTDANNKFCIFSCRTQAWSVATLIEGLKFIEDL